jgi:hypothetical protein
MLAGWRNCVLNLLLSLFSWHIIDIEDNGVLSGCDWRKKFDLGGNIYCNYWYMSIIVVYIQIKYSIHTSRRDSARPFICSLSLLEADSAFSDTMTASICLKDDATQCSFSFLLHLDRAMVFVLWYPAIVCKPTRCQLLPKPTIYRLDTTVNT